MKRFFIWASFVAIIGLVVWGLIAAEKKANREAQNIILPTEISTTTDHIRGSSIAPVTLVEYGDFQCPACKTYHPIVEQVLKAKGPDAVRFVFRHYPLPQHGNAMPAAKAAEAAGVQGKFWEMYNMLYEKQSEWSGSSDAKSIFVGYAKEMGLDESKFLADYDSKELKEKITNQSKGGAKAGVNSTPTFLVNGKEIANPQSYDEFTKIIDDAIPKINI